MWDTIRRIDSSDENVSKFVFEKDDAVAEAVLYKYGSYQARTVICCSTQSGCPVGCRFCGAGDAFIRSLHADEIVSQPVHLLSLVDCHPDMMERLQIMFMSMGEPLLNQTHLIPALNQLYSSFPTAALLISTSAPAVNYDTIRAVSQAIPTIGLQFSVHESTDEARDKLIPFARKLDLGQIAVEGRKWAEDTGRRPFFNYCVHDENNSMEDVARLFSLFPPSIWESTISVICERDESIAAANERQRTLASDFMEKMLGVGYSSRMFDPAGQDDIGGGCGQLWFVQDWMQRNSKLAHASVGAGLDKVHTPVKLSARIPGQ